MHELVHEALEQTLAERGAAVVVLGRDDRIAYAPDRARHQLAAWFDGFDPSVGRLPRELRSWLDQPLAAPFHARSARGSLTLRLVAGGRYDGQRVLVIEEVAARTPSVDALTALGLTRRQAEVLRLVAAGLPDGQVAGALSIAVPTVRKHLEHIYLRLAVNTRAAAVARALGSS